MATRFQIKRNTVSGVVPTTGDIANGELAVNLADRKLFTSNGSAVFELGSNLTNLSVTGNVTVKGIIANGSLGTAGQVLTTNSTGVYWSTPTTSAVNTAAQYAWTNTHTFSANVNFDSNTLFVDSVNNRVGIGTGTPAYLLDVNGIVCLRPSAGEGGEIYFANPDNGSLGLIVDVGGADNPRIFSVRDNMSMNIGQLGGTGGTVSMFTAATERMRIDASGNVGIGNTAPAHKLRVEGDISLSGGVHANGSLGTSGQVLTSNGTGVYWSSAAGGFTNGSSISVNNFVITGALTANSSNGTSGQVLHSNGTGVYWATDDQGVTSVATGSGLTGGTITSTGTISVIANNGLSANATGVYVVPGNGLIASNSTGVHVGQGTGVTVNSTTVSVNASYIATISANNASFLGGTAAASYQLNSTLAANVATLASNSATYANASITNTFTVGTGTYFIANGNVGIGNSAPAHKLRVQGDISLSGGIHANGSLGTAGQVLTSNSTGVYWSSGGTITAPVRETFVANSTVNTTFTVTGGYSPGIIDVYRNGVKMVSGTDVDVSSGTTITLTTAAANGDTVEVVGYTALSVSDAVKKSGDTMTANLIMSSNSSIQVNNLSVVSPANTISVSANLSPATGNTYDLGSTSARWRNIYTNDLNLSNGLGDYTIVEGEDDLFLYNNKKGKVYKFALIEVKPEDAPRKIGE